MTTPPPFEKTSAEERKAILKALAHRLQISARIAERGSDPICRSLLALSVRLAGSCEEVAADPKRGNDVIEKALRLLSEFALRRPERTTH
ncbi:hypothetical protein QTL96_28165 [Rhizobium sp. S163]|nr:hypothetical protein [Rhizobium sp. S163]